jgi:hypothetical protein
MPSLHTEVRTLLTGLGFGESPRWHEDRLWFSNWGRQEVVAVDLDGRSEVMLRVPTSLPFCIDWLPDGPLLVVSGPTPICAAFRIRVGMKLSLTAAAISTSTVAPASSLSSAQMARLDRSPMVLHSPMAWR